MMSEQEREREKVIRMGEAQRENDGGKKDEENIRKAMEDQLMLKWFNRETQTSYK